MSRCRFIISASRPKLLGAFASTCLEKWTYLVRRMARPGPLLASEIVPPRFVTRLNARGVETASLTPNDPGIWLLDVTTEFTFCLSLLSRSKGAPILTASRGPHHVDQPPTSHLDRRMPFYILHSCTPGPSQRFLTSPQSPTLHSTYNTILPISRTSNFSLSYRTSRVARTFPFVWLPLAADLSFHFDTHF
jgi:hypothetical protein